MIVCDRLFAVLAPYERRGVGYWSWTIERVHSHKIIKASRLERHEPTFHSVRLELKNILCIATCKYLHRFRLVTRDLVEINHLSLPRPNQLHAILLEC